ncbi:hypothetical protein [Streptomyces sp. NPDC002825]|uniref:hypothetical protein n=1 Tax=Streptomyces sp. NPDC002825 TaxID=3154666 RepID=UPI003327C97B
MDEEPVIIKLTRDQAFVLSEWLYEVMMQSDKLDAIVPDRAVWSGIYATSGTLETTLLRMLSRGRYGVDLEEYAADGSAAARTGVGLVA